MNPKQVTILAILAAIAGAVYFSVNAKRESSINKEQTMKIGDRAVQDFDVAAVTKVTIREKGQQVNLTKDGDTWGIAERDNYAANATKIRGLLYTMKDMKIAESRSVRGESALKALQLLSPDQAGEGGSGAGTLVEITAGDQKRSLVFGGNFDSAGSSGRFVKTSSGAVYVVSTVLRNLETDASAWLDKEFFKVQKSKKITVAHEKPEDGFTLMRESDGSPLKLEGASEGEEVDSAKIGGLNNLLSSANFSDYITGDAAKPEKTGLDKAVVATIETFDNFTYVVNVGNKTGDGKYYLSYEVSAEIADPPAPEPEPNEEEDQKLTDEERAIKTAEKQARQEKRDEHKRLTEKLATEKKFVAKVYTVDSWLVEKLLSKRSDLLKTEEDKKKEAEAAANGGDGAASPNIITQGPNGERKITATTPPISIDPAILEAERKKQEQAVIDKQKADSDAAAIRRMLEDKKREDAEKDKADAGEKPAAEAEKPAAGAEKPAAGGEKPAAGGEKPAAGGENPEEGQEEEEKPAETGAEPAAE